MSAAFELLVRPEITIVAVLIGALAYKVKIMQPVATGPIFFAVVQHDAEIFTLIILLYAASFAMQRWGNSTKVARGSATILAPLFMAAGLGVVLLYAADVFVYHFFVTRLYARDLVTFSKEPRAGLSLLHSGWRTIGRHHVRRLAILAILILVVLRACFKLLAARVPARRQSRLVAFAALPFAILWLIPARTYVYSLGDKPLYENFIERNKDFFFRNNFSGAFRARILATPPVEIGGPGRGLRINVILLLVESLSAYQSGFFSGVEDWTPRLDDIARHETALTNFYANGWTTIGGLISLLTATFPFVPEHTAFNEWGSPRLTDFLDVPRPLPQTLSKWGYSTEFVAAGDLNFLDQGQWLRGIGFQKLVGGDDPRFAKQKVRGPFNSVPDRLLYDVALDELAQMPAGRPYFMVVQTFWSHRPFTDPNGGPLNDEEPVMRETDAQIGTFCERLRAAGFYQKGLLFITGDHRAAEPFHRVEFKRFGASAAARIPAVIVTRAVELPRVITQDFQQCDFGPSVESLVGDRYWRGPQEGSFLTSPLTPPDCILQAEGLDRDLIFVKCGAKQGAVRVAADATRFVSGAVPKEASIVQTVNRTRVRRVK